MAFLGTKPDEEVMEKVIDKILEKPFYASDKTKRKKKISMKKYI
jgi:hypothetical protein